MRKVFGLIKISLIMCALIIAGGGGILTSCQKKVSGTTDSTRSGVSGDLLVWMDNEDWAQAIITGFNEKYPDVNVKYEVVGNVDTRGKVSLDGPAGIGPDVFFMPHDHFGNAIIDGVLEPFTASEKARYSEFLLDAAIKTCTSDGDLYALPIFTENIAFFYNKDLLGGAPVPQTFEDVIAFAKTYNDPSKSKYALRWQVDDSYHNYFFLTAFGFKLFGQNFDDYKTPNFDSPEVAKGVDFHHSLRQYFNVNTADATWDFTVASFQKGEVPFTITGPWAIGDAKTNKVNFGITKLPTIAGNQPRSFSGVIIGAVSSYAKNPDAAFAFLDFIDSVEGQTISFNVTGKLAAYKDISGIPGLRDDVHLKGIMEQAPYSDPMPTIPEVNQMWDALKALFTFTWDNQLTTKQAQDKAMETYDTALQMAGKSRK